MTNFTDQVAADQAAKAAQRAEAKVQQSAARAKLVADAILAVAQGQQWPAYNSLDEMYQAAYTYDGIGQDPWFGDATPNNKGVTKGFARFKSAARSALGEAALADDGAIVYKTKDGAGIPDRQTLQNWHNTRAQKLQRDLEAENTKRERVNAVFGLEMPKLDLRELNAGS
jgi:hypothetical protein